MPPGKSASRYVLSSAAPTRITHSIADELRPPRASLPLITGWNLAEQGTVVIRLRRAPLQAGSPCSRGLFPVLQLELAKAEALEDFRTLQFTRGLVQSRNRSLVISTHQQQCRQPTGRVRVVR